MFNEKRYKFNIMYGSITSVDYVPIQVLIKEKEKVKVNKTVRRENPVNNKKRVKPLIEQEKMTAMLKDVLNKTPPMYVRVWQNDNDGGGITSRGPILELKKDTLTYIDSVYKTENEVPYESVLGFKKQNDYIFTDVNNYFKTYKPPKKCPPDKILNPKTNRCIKK